MTRVQVEDTSETGTGESTALPGAASANTRRRIVVKSEPVAVTTQEAVDGSCEMRIASVEQSELGNIMELSITGHVLKWARRSNLSRGLSLRGWMDGTWRITATSQLPGTCVRKLTPACWS